MLLSCASIAQIHAELCTQNWNGKFQSEALTENAVTLAEHLGARFSTQKTDPSSNLEFEDGVTYIHAAFPDGSWAVIDTSEILYTSN
jgi:hypothetical protein